MECYSLAGRKCVANDFREDQDHRQLALETLLRLVRWILACSHEILPGYFFKFLCSPLVVNHSFIH